MKSSYILLTIFLLLSFRSVALADFEPEPNGHPDGTVGSGTRLCTPHKGGQRREENC